ncbi:hypothetical protein Mapa_006231 [Marchantia paleacea]|nr:hypothetical protein Mapa_006231 [Marchantia paleacea]
MTVTFHEGTPKLQLLLFSPSLGRPVCSNRPRVAVFGVRSSRVVHVLSSQVEVILSGLRRSWSG